MKPLTGIKAAAVAVLCAMVMGPARAQDAGDDQDAWRQVWQSAPGFIDYTGGLDDKGRMVLEGTLHSNARSTSVPFRGRWTPNEDGTVLQEFWQRDDSGEWQTWFRGLYRPR